MKNNLETGNNRSGWSFLGKLLTVIDAMIVVAIALGQLAISLYGLYVLFITGGSQHPFIFIPYVLIGLISASILLSCRRITRIIAIGWQSVFVSAVLIMANPASASDRFFRERVVWVIPATLYLLLSSTIQWRRKEKIKSV